MDRLKKLSQLSSVVSIAVGVGIAKEFTDWIIKFNLPSWFPHVTAVIVVVITFQFLKFIFEAIFDMSVTMRRILLGHQFIEGTWLDIMSHNGKPISYGVTRIVSSGSSFRISGEDYDLNANNTGFYSLDMLVFEFPKIKYKYTYQRSDSLGLAQEGFGEFQFRERNGAPVKYAGFTFDLGEGKRITFEGWKVENKAVLSLLDKPASDKEAILSFFRSKLESSSKQVA